MVKFADRMIFNSVFRGHGFTSPRTTSKSPNMWGKNVQIQIRIHIFVSSGNGHQVFPILESMAAWRRGGRIIGDSKEVASQVREKDESVSESVSESR